MDYQKFIEQLPTLYENWNQHSVRPKSQQFQQVISQVKGMTTANVMQLLNFAVTCMETNEIYCEVGSFQGATLIGALLDRSETRGHAIDNFSKFDSEGTNRQKLQENLQKFNLENRVRFWERDFEEFFWERQEIEMDKKIGVYFYDAAHNYRSQISGLLLIKPFLANQAVLVVDDANQKQVRQANWDFIATNPKCQLLLELLTPGNGYPTFWNGIHVLSWDASKSSNYSAPTFCKRHQELVKPTHNLSQREGSVEKLYKQALKLHQQQKFLLAEKKYREFLLSNQDDANAWLNLGILCYEMGSYEEAIDSISKSLEIKGGNADTYYYLGLAFEKNSQTDRAISAYQKAVDKKDLRAGDRLLSLLYRNPPEINS